MWILGLNVKCFNLLMVSCIYSRISSNLFASESLQFYLCLNLPAIHRFKKLPEVLISQHSCYNRAG